MRLLGEATLRGVAIRHPGMRRLVVAGASATATAIAIAGNLAGPEVAFDFLCLWPLGLVAWLAGFRAGLALALACATASLGTGLLSHPTLTAGLKLWNFFVELGVYWSQVVLVSILHARVNEERHLARTDAVTRLDNRRAFEEAADRELERARRQGRPVTVAYLDVDDFKQLNDRWGHSAGDEVLVVVGATLRAETRRIDTAARIGGDEFGLLLPDTTASAAAALLARLRGRMGVALAQRGRHVTLSVGAVTFQAAPATVAEMVARADEAMYQAKRAGKGTIHLEVCAGPAPATRDEAHPSTGDAVAHPA